MNKVSPKVLLHSKWTKMNIVNKEKHFSVIDVEYNEENLVVKCVIEAVMTHNTYEINWRDFKNGALWRAGWK